MDFSHSIRKVIAVPRANNEKLLVDEELPWVDDVINLDPPCNKMQIFSLQDMEELDL